MAHLGDFTPQLHSNWYVVSAFICNVCTNQAPFIYLSHTWRLSYYYWLCFSIHTWIFSCEGKTSRVECSAGTYATAGSTKCTKCPKGAHCPTKTLETYILCANGTYSDTEGSSDCKLCDAGFRCPNVGMEAPLVCPNGTYSNTTGAVECILCPAGFRWGWVFFHWHISFAHHQSNVNERKFVKTKEIVFIVDYIYSLCQWRRAFLGCP